MLSTSVLIAPFMVKHMTDIAHMISGRFFWIIQDKIIELRLFEFDNGSLGPLAYGANRRGVVGQPPPCVLSFGLVTKERHAESGS